MGSLLIAGITLAVGLVLPSVAAEPHSAWGNKSEIGLLIATSVLVFATSVLAIYTAKLWNATGDLVKGARRAEAPIFFPQLLEHTGFTQGRPVPQGRRAFFTYAFLNTGKTAGVIRRFRDYSRYQSIETSPQFQDQPWERRKENYVPIQSGATGFPVNVQVPAGLTGEQVFAGFAERIPVFIVGEIEYEDIFDNVWIQGFCIEVRNMIPTTIDGVDRMMFQVQRAGGGNYNYRREISNQSA